MDNQRLRETLAEERSSSRLSLALQALLSDAEGDWSSAHDLVQDDESAHAAWVHAYLHRKEGDSSNARYWYVKAGKPYCNQSLEHEWSLIVNELRK